MKRLLASQSLTIRGSGVVPTDARLAEQVCTSTLGLLARQFFETFLVPHRTPAGVSEGPAQNDPPTEVTLKTRFRIEMSVERHASAKQAVAELVALRNTLTHQLVELFDLWSEPGCETALAYLTTSCERIGRDLEDLRGWAKAMDEARGEFALALQSGQVGDLVLNELARDGVVDWSRAGIVSCLCEAAQAICFDGWTPLLPAIAYIESRDPDQTPMNYRCRSWPQVIHESKRFDLKYTSEPDDTKVDFYRVRSKRMPASH